MKAIPCVHCSIYNCFLPWDFYQDLLTNKQFSIQILSGSLIMLDSENIELVWSNLTLKCIVLMANKYPVDWTFCLVPNYKHSFNGSQKLHDKLTLKWSH